MRGQLQIMARQKALPPTLAPRLINRDAAAAYVSISPTLFDRMVEDGGMPRPRLLGSKGRAWDVRELDASFAGRARMPQTDQTRGMSMPRRLLPFIERWYDRHGKLRVYFRQGKGRRVPLTVSVGSAGFNAAYQAALSGQLSPAPERHHRSVAGTIAALIVSYVRSAAYIGLREMTILATSLGLRHLESNMAIAP
jgi:predicted DNA-binding transcriptional regulator AlpA